MGEIAEYCKSCEYPFQQMGACAKPGVPEIYAYMSLLPYMLAIFILIRPLLTRRLSHIITACLVVSAYLITDQIIKKLIKSPRPLLSCNTSYGMPSSHMTVLVVYTYYYLHNFSTKLYVKFMMVALCVVQGIARVELNYHTLEQVIAGSLFAVVYSAVFLVYWDLGYPRVKGWISKVTVVLDDYHYIKQNM